MSWLSKEDTPIKPEILLRFFCKSKIFINCVPNGTNRYHKQVLSISSVDDIRLTLPSVEILKNSVLRKPHIHRSHFLGNTVVQLFVRNFLANCFSDSAPRKTFGPVQLYILTFFRLITRALLRMYKMMTLKAHIISPETLETFQ
jgi:hypothetical protein